MQELLHKIGSFMENGELAPGNMSHAAFLKLKYEIQMTILEVQYGVKKNPKYEYEEHA